MLTTTILKGASRLILSTALLAALLGPAGAFAQDPTLDPGAAAAAEAQSPGALAFEKTEVDFGTIPDGEVVEIAYKFKNPTANVIKITKIQPGCGCTAANNNPSQVAAGGDETIRVQFDSRNRPGATVKNLTVFTEEGGKAHQYRLLFRGQVTQEISLRPPSINLGEIPEGQGMTQTAMLVLGPSVTATVKEVNVSDPRLKVIAKETKEVSAAEGGGRQLVYEVVVPPDYPQGELNANVTFVTDYEKTPSHTLYVRGSVRGEFSNSPSRIQGALTKDSMISRRIVVTSNKNRPFQIKEVVANVALKHSHQLLPGNSESTQIVEMLFDATGAEAKPVTGDVVLKVEDADGKASELRAAVYLIVRDPRPSAAVPQGARPQPAALPAQ